MKKIIKYTALIALIASSVISCSSDSSQGMLRSIVDSQKKVSYTIKKSSYNNIGKYFVSVENDGIWKAKYGLVQDENNNDKIIVKREKYVNSGTDKIMSVLDIYTKGNDSYVLFADENNKETKIVNGKEVVYHKTTIKHFNNSLLNSAFTDVTPSSIKGSIKNLTENGYIISDETTTGTSNLYIYQVPWNASNRPTADEKYSLTGIYNADYKSSRYNNYALVKDSSKPQNILGFIISLTDDDDDKSSYHASDAYYYVSLDGIHNNEIKFDDADGDGEKEPIVAASKVDNSNTYIVLTQDGDSYKGNILLDTKLTQLWNNESNSDTFAAHLPTMSYNSDATNPGYLIAMNSNDHLYIYNTKATDNRISTVSGETVEYATSLNNATDVIFIRYVQTSGDVDQYWVATKGNGYYTIYIDNKAVAKESTKHKTEDGFKDPA